MSGVPRRRRSFGITAQAAVAMALCFSAASHARAQWVMEESHTTASLRGVVSVGGGVAWASGTNGTVVRTEDGGFVWQGCAVPEGAGSLDFRGIQAFDEQTAFVMSSGPGAQSRVYRTTDGCRTWTLVRTNAQPTGFWDALRFSDRAHGMILGDPVDGQFVVLRTNDGGVTWESAAGTPADEATGQSAFAASNSALLLRSASDWSFCTGGPAGPHVWHSSMEPYSGHGTAGPLARSDSSEELISESKGESIGCFSLATHAGTVVAVGGDYTHPDTGDDNAWTTAVDANSAAAREEARRHPDFHFTPALARPDGFRSSVDYDEAAKAWVAVGPNGTDVSTDDGLHWRALNPRSPVEKSAIRDWNALSLPFVVGPHGRIAKLRSDMLQYAAPGH